MFSDLPCYVMCDSLKLLQFSMDAVVPFSRLRRDDWLTGELTASYYIQFEWPEWEKGHHGRQICSSLKTWILSFNMRSCHNFL